MSEAQRGQRKRKKNTHIPSPCDIEPRSIYSRALFPQERRKIDKRDTKKAKKKRAAPESSWLADFRTFTATPIRPPPPPKYPRRHACIKRCALGADLRTDSLIPKSNAFFFFETRLVCAVRVRHLRFVRRYRRLCEPSFLDQPHFRLFSLSRVSFSFPPSFYAVCFAGEWCASRCCTCVFFFAFCSHHRHFCPFSFCVCLFRWCLCVFDVCARVVLSFLRFVFSKRCQVLLSPSFFSFVFFIYLHLYLYLLPLLPAEGIFPRLLFTFVYIFR